MPLPQQRSGDQTDLWAILAAAVRARSDHLLVASAISGLGTAVLVLMFWRWPARADLVAAGTIVSCFGLWGVLDRAIVDARTDARRQLLRVVRTTIAVLGGIGAIVIVFSAMTAVIGRWVS